MSLQTEHTSSSPLKKRRRSSASSSSTSSIDENERNSKHFHSHQPSLVALPPPMISNSDKPASSALPTPGPSPAALPSSSNVTYYPIYTAHPGHFYLASPPLHPSSPSHPTKILPKLPAHHQAPPTPATLPSSPPSLPYTFYHPYQISPPIQPTNSTPYHHHHTSATTTTTADQREQARKQSHSAIERRRREKINDKIMQLKQLIPTCANQENLHKMSILQSSIDYITYLKNILEQIEKQGGEKLDLVAHQGKLNSIKTPRSMLPKEVEPYTSQFNAHQVHQSSLSPTLPSSSASNAKSAPQQQRCLKPIDIIKSKNQPILSSPPSSSSSSLSSSSGRSTPVLVSETNPSSPKNMSLKNMLC